jgi:arylsulfatase A-like enzyme
MAGSSGGADLADDAIGWLRHHKALMADKPFFIDWANGCLRDPHHIMKEWADRYVKTAQRWLSRPLTRWRGERKLNRQTPGGLR